MGFNNAHKPSVFPSLRRLLGWCSGHGGPLEGTADCPLCGPARSPSTCRRVAGCVVTSTAHTHWREADKSLQESPVHMFKNIYLESKRI